MPVVNVILAVARNPRFVVGLGFALGGLFLYLAVRGIDWGEVRAQLAGAAIPAVAGALAISLASAFTRAVRWRMQWVMARVSLRRLFVVEMSALGLNNVSPVRLLDEPAVLTMLTLRDKHPAPLVMATIITTRVQDLMVTMAFTFSAVLFLPGIRQQAVPVVALIIVVIGVFGVVLNLGRLARRFPTLGRIPGLLTYEEAIGAMFRRKRRMALTALLTVTYWLMLAPAAWLLARGMGLDLPLHHALIVTLGSLFFATSLPGLPGALGSFEAAAEFILSALGYPNRELNLGFALILHLILFIPPILFAVVVLPREGIGVLQSWRRIAGR